MILRAGELLGLIPGHPDPVTDLAWFRCLLFALAAFWAVLAARARPVIWALLAGTLFFEAAMGFWVLTFERPYGLLIDPVATRRAADVAVAAASNVDAESFLASDPAPRRLTAPLERVVPGPLLLFLPTVLPLFVVPVLAFLISGLWVDRARAPLAALLWLAFSTGDLEATRGVGFVPGLWSRPDASLVLVVVVGTVLGLGRLRLGKLPATIVGAVVVLGWYFVPGVSSGLGSGDTLRLLTLDQGLWLWLALVGFRRGADATSQSFVFGGALLLLIAMVLGADPWGGAALYRLGLVLASSGPVAELAQRVGKAVPRNLAARLGGADPAALGVALLLLAFVPGSFLAWWNPARLDPVANDSLLPVSPTVAEAMAWIRRSTPPDAVFVASPEYAPAVATLAGRRVLRAPGLLSANDEERRLRAERLVLSGADPGRVGDRYGLTHLFVAPGDFRAYGIQSPADFDGRPRFRLSYSGPGAFRIYELVR